MKKNSLILAMLCLVGSAFAQEEKSGSTVEAGVDFVSSYVWRGLESDDRPNFQPYASYGKGGFSVMYWGSYSPWSDYAESDIYLSYSFKSLTLSVNDYFDHNGGTGFGNFTKYESSHMVEAQLKYEALAEKFPINLTLGTFVFGSVVDEGDISGSTYFEIEKPFSVNKFDFSAFVGSSLAGNYYADGFAVVNLGAKAMRSFELSDKLSLPVILSAISNPDQNDFFVVASVGICFSK